MGEVKSVKMDTWTTTESPNTLFADGKFEGDKLQLYYYVYPVPQGSEYSVFMVLSSMRQKCSKQSQKQRRSNTTYTMLVGAKSNKVPLESQ